LCPTKVNHRAELWVWTGLIKYPQGAVASVIGGAKGVFFKPVRVLVHTQMHLHIGIELVQIGAVGFVIRWSVKIQQVNDGSIPDPVVFSFVFKLNIVFLSHVPAANHIGLVFMEFHKGFNVVAIGTGNIPKINDLYFFALQFWGFWNADLTGKSQDKKKDQGKKADGHRMRESGNSIAISACRLKIPNPDFKNSPSGKRTFKAGECGFLVPQILELDLPKFL
jgi:hypothetical protein